MKAVLFASVLVLSATAAFAADGKASTKPDAVAVDNACTADAATAGCGDEKVGTGLMRCIHAYKKAHKEFKVSDACHASMKTMHEDHAAKKAN